jgi:hypothetical protein
MANAASLIRAVFSYIFGRSNPDSIFDCATEIVVVVTHKKAVSSFSSVAITLFTIK